MQIFLSNHFKKCFKKSPKLVRENFYVRSSMLLVDKFNPLLNNHALSGKFNGYRSINITADWRAVFKEDKGGDSIYFIDLGSHSQLYE